MPLLVLTWGLRSYGPLDLAHLHASIPHLARGTSRYCNCSWRPSLWRRWQTRRAREEGPRSLSHLQRHRVLPVVVGVCQSAFSAMPRTSTTVASPLRLSSTLAPYSPAAAVSLLGCTAASRMGASAFGRTSPTPTPPAGAGEVVIAFACRCLFCGGSSGGFERDAANSLVAGKLRMPPILEHASHSIPEAETVVSEIALVRMPSPRDLELEACD